MTARKRIGIQPHLYCEPLRGAPGSSSRYAITADAPAHLARALRERRLDLAFLTPIDYARDGSLYYAVPGIAAASSAATGTITLHFRRDLRNIGSLAADPSSASEIVLARIILAEQFGVQPAIVPTDGSLEEGIRKADATLLVGDASLRGRLRDAQSIDLVEEWFEMTDLPYVHGLWCGRERGAGPEDLAVLSGMRDAGVEALAAVAATAGGTHGLGSFTPEEILEVLEGFQFELTEDVADGMTEFLRYAYYQGILPDVVDLQYFDASPASDDEEISPPSIH